MGSHLNTPTPPLTASSSTPAASTHGPPTPAPAPAPTPAAGKCTRYHVLYCLDVLAAHFEHRQPVSPPFEDKDERLALFVTWNTRSNSAGDRDRRRPALRGCIGNFTPMPLANGLRDHALISALEDHRFSPIRQSELPSLSCSVSLLTPTVPISDPLAWTPGQHGIHISFTHPTTHRRLSATYLPEIATDQGWSREETIQSAIQKAGYRGKVVVGDDVWKSLKVGVYESTKCAVSWDEYRAWVTKRDAEGEAEEEEDDDDEA